MGTVTVAVVERCNHKFRREQPLGVYTVDFYCAAKKLVIEIDGESHLSKEAQGYDAIRDSWMQQGIRVLRFTCKQIEHDTKNVLAQIDAALRGEV